MQPYLHSLVSHVMVIKCRGNFTLNDRNKKCKQGSKIHSILMCSFGNMLFGTVKRRGMLTAVLFCEGFTPAVACRPRNCEVALASEINLNPLFTRKWNHLSCINVLERL